MKRLFFTLVLCPLLLVGCGTTPVAPELAKAVAPTNYAVITPETTASIVLVRDMGLLGMAASAYIYVDGEKVAVLEAGEKTTLYLKPDQYIIGMTLGTSEDYKEVNLKPNRQAIIRVCADDDYSGAHTLLRVK